MVVLALPGHITDSAAAGLALHLAQSMVLLAGPSVEWMTTDPHEGDGLTGATWGAISGDTHGQHTCDV